MAYLHHGLSPPLMSEKFKQELLILLELRGSNCQCKFCKTFIYKTWDMWIDK